MREAVKAAGLEPDDILALGSGAPGPLNPDSGVVLHTPNMPGWDNVPLAKMLGDALNIPAFIANDVDLGTLGEFALGAGQGHQHVVGIFVGTGIGGGLILNGELWQGWRRAAAEIGHTIVLADGPYAAAATGAAWRRWPAARRSSGISRPASKLAGERDPRTAESR